MNALERLWDKLVDLVEGPESGSKDYSQLQAPAKPPVVTPPVKRKKKTVAKGKRKKKKE